MPGRATQFFFSRHGTKFTLNVDAVNDPKSILTACIANRIRIYRTREINKIANNIWGYAGNSQLDVPSGSVRQETMDADSEILPVYFEGGNCMTVMNKKNRTVVLISSDCLKISMKMLTMAEAEVHKRYCKFFKVNEYSLLWLDHAPFHLDLFMSWIGKKLVISDYSISANMAITIYKRTKERVYKDVADVCTYVHKLLTNETEKIIQLCQSRDIDVVKGPLSFCGHENGKMQMMAIYANGIIGENWYLAMPCLSLCAKIDDAFASWFTVHFPNIELHFIGGQMGVLSVLTVNGGVRCATTVQPPCAAPDRT